MKNLILTLIVISFSLGQQLKAANKSEGAVTFTIVLDSGIKFKPVIVVYENAWYRNDTPLAEQILYKPISAKGNVYKFVFPAKSGRQYFSVVGKDAIKDKYMLSMYHFEQGDVIQMNIHYDQSRKDFVSTFLGNHSAKYRCIQEMQQANHLKNVMPILQNYQSEISELSYQLLRIDCMSRAQAASLKTKTQNYDIAKRNGDTIKASGIAEEYFRAYQSLDFGGLPSALLYQSKDYLSYRYNELLTVTTFKNRSAKALTLFEEIKKVADSGLRDRLLVLFFIDNWKNLSNEYDRSLNWAINNVSDKNCLLKLRAYLRSAKGQKAKNFSFQDAAGKYISLNDFRGKVVFIDFYFTGCIFCMQYYKNVLADVEKQFSLKRDMVFVSVSVDKDKAKWLNTLKGGNYTSDTSINLFTNGEGGGQEFIKYYNINLYPALMLIDRKGNLVSFADRELRNKNALVNALNKLLLR